MIERSFIDTMSLPNELRSELVKQHMTPISDALWESLRNEEMEGWSRLGNLTEANHQALYEIIAQSADSISDDEIILSY